MKKNKRIFYWALGGFFFVSVMGSFLHFVYELTGNNFAIGLFVPVNESVWEHLKLGFTAMLLFSLLDWWFFQFKPNYEIGKALGALAMSTLIVVVFYTYTAITGDSILAIDLSTYFIGAALMQFIWYRFMIAKPLPQYYFYIGGVLIFAQLILFMIFSVYPPNIDLFLDSVTGSYGIQ